MREVLVEQRRIELHAPGLLAASANIASASLNGMLVVSLAGAPGGEDHLVVASRSTQRRLRQFVAGDFDPAAGDAFVGGPG